jgi:hypothetical protein
MRPRSGAFSIFMPPSNPTSVTGSNPQFGSSSQFNIPSFIQPYNFAADAQQNSDFTNSMGQFITQNRGQTESNLGLPQLRDTFLRGNQALGQLQSSIFNIPNTIADTTHNSLLNEGQRQSMMDANAVPLTRELNQMQLAQNATGARLNQAETTAQNIEAANLMPWEKQYDAITRQQAAQMTGWTTANADELNRLISNQQSGLTWTNDEAQRANALAVQELQYRQALDTASMQNTGAIAALRARATYGLG